LAPSGLVSQAGLNGDGLTSPQTSSPEPAALQKFPESTSAAVVLHS
jgi:hypothetical protein